MCVSCGQSLVLLVVLCLCETTHRFQRWNLLRNNVDVRYVSYSTSSPPSNSSVLFDVKSACFLWLSLNKTFLMHDDEVSVISELQWNFKKTKNLLLLLSLMQTPQLPGRKRKKTDENRSSQHSVHRLDRRCFILLDCSMTSFTPFDPQHCHNQEQHFHLTPFFWNDSTQYHITECTEYIYIQRPLRSSNLLYI